jgi:hypothetical protein
VQIDVGVEVLAAESIDDCGKALWNILNSTLPSTFPVIGDPRLNEINGLRWFLC